MSRRSSDDAPEHPGRILLKRAMEPLGISRNQLARDIDVPVGQISDITNGKRGVTADTALRLGRYFGTAPELWLRLQADYDLHVARSSLWPEIAPRVRVLDAAAPAPAIALAVPAASGNGEIGGTPPSATDTDREPETAHEIAASPGDGAGEAVAPDLADEVGDEPDDLVIPPAPER